MKCFGPKAQDADLWILIWEEVHRVHEEGILLEVDDVKAQREEGKAANVALREISHQKK